MGLEHNSQPLELQKINPTSPLPRPHSAVIQSSVAILKGNDINRQCQSQQGVESLVKIN